MVEFRVLGSLEVVGRDGPLGLGAPKQRALLAVLLLHRGEPVSTDRLIDEIWGERPPASATKLVQGYVSNLRKVLDDGLLVTQGRGYMLRARPGQLDVDRFEALAAQGRRTLGQGDASTAGAMLRDALGVWRGPPLADFAYEPFAQAEIARLDEARLAALEDRIDADLACAEHARLVAELQALVRDHPLRERFRGQLMLALYRSGRQADALEVYQRARGHLADELGLEPGPALRALQSQILKQEAALETGNGARPRLPGAPGGFAQPREAEATPLPTTPTVGRERERAEISRLLSSRDVRLLTLTGPGGVGKTRLALVVAASSAPAYPDGVVWAELAGVADPEDVPSAIARALAIVAQPGEPVVEMLTRWLQARQLLLVIDNFEHVLGAAELLGRLHRTCAALTMLVTSREALNLAAEHRYEVAPLAVPRGTEAATPAQLEATPATAMFLQAIRRRDAGFAPTPAIAPAIARICARMDGLPLAVELAAARAEMFGIDELAFALHALDGLGSGPRDAPARQRTLESTIEWSYRLLDHDEQIAFARFAVFSGGATADAGQSVTGADLEILQALVDKSLLTRRWHPDGRTRLIMLDTIRQYAHRRLENDSEAEQVHRRHLEYYRRLVEQAIGRLSTRQRPDALALLDLEIDNIRSALRYALDADPAGAVRLAGQLGRYWWIRSDPDALRWLDTALLAAGEGAPAQDRALAQLRRAIRLAWSREDSEAVRALETAVELYREVGDHAGMSAAYGELASCAEHVGDMDWCTACVEAAVEHARLSGDDRVLGISLAWRATRAPFGEGVKLLAQAARPLMAAGDAETVADAYSYLAYTGIKEGRVGEALDLLGVALGAAESIGIPPSTMLVWGNIGLAKLFDGDTEGARDAFSRQLRLCADQSFMFGADEGLAGLAAVAGIDGQYERVARLLGAARALGYPMADDQPVEDRLERDFYRPARARCGTHAWTRAEREGATLAYDQAIRYALDADETGLDPDTVHRQE